MRAGVEQHQELPAHGEDQSEADQHEGDQEGGEETVRLSLPPGGDGVPEKDGDDAVPEQREEREPEERAQRGHYRPQLGRRGGVRG